jgi:hypothetical protein
MNTLTIVTSRQGFEAIKAGTKTRERRQATPYWTTRLCTPDGRPRAYERIRLLGGYQPDAPRLTTQFRGIKKIGADYHILLGKLLAEENTPTTAPNLTVVYLVGPQGECQPQPVHPEATDALASLRALNRLFATPQDIHTEVLRLKESYQQQYGRTKTVAEINELAADRIIALYAYSAAVVGGATALSGALPGPGTVLALGGAFVDIELCKELQAKMIRALALVYGHRYGTESRKRLRGFLTELCLRSQVRKEQATRLRTNAMMYLTRQYLKGPVLHTVTDVCRSIGIPFSKRAFQKAVPFGVGLVTGFQANSLTTRWIGHNAKAFFASCG